MRNGMSLKSSSQSEPASGCHGLPLDLWRDVLSYLHVVDLCHAAQVCRSWRCLVASLDNSSWRLFFSQSTEWKHPNWPKSDEDEVRKTWQTLYREHAILSKLWTYPSKHINTSKCFAPIFNKFERKTIEVGTHCIHKTLRSALDVATQYDRILIHPGLYDEQFEISSKIPFELLGHGPPGSVILIISVEQNAITARLCNLYIKAPWFTQYVIKVVSGHLQVDNCVMEESHIMVQHPATCHFRYCNLRRVSMTLYHVNASLIERCHFKHCVVSVQGFPKETRGWSYEHIDSLTQNWNPRPDRRHDHLVSSVFDDMESSLHTTQSLNTTSAFEINKSEVDSIGVASIDYLSDHSSNKSQVNGQGGSIHDSDSSYTFTSFSSLSSQHSQGDHHDTQDIHQDNNDSVLSNHDNHAKSGRTENNINNIHDNNECDIQDKNDSHLGTAQPSTSAHVSNKDVDELQGKSGFLGLSISSRSKLTLQTLPAMHVLEQSSSEGSHSTASSSNISLLSDSGGGGHISPPWSSDSESVLEAKLQTSFRDTLQKDPQLLEMVNQTQGPVFRHCLFHHGVGGLKVSLQAHCRIEHNVFRDLQYAIRCLQNAKACVLENEICLCKTSGIYMRLAAHGLIAGNDIYYTNEAAIDVRRHADPVIQCNRIHHSKRSGIVVLGSGAGLIRGNDIYQNRESAIYVLYRGNPYIIGNRICHGMTSGIAVQENGCGYIVDNYIAHNRWAGVDIREGGDPLVSKNLICNGQANGILVSNKGRGLIEANTIKGNDGCGVYIMGGTPLIQLNQIYNNNATGVALVTDAEEDDASTTDMQSLSSDVSELDAYSIDGESPMHLPNAPARPDHAHICFNTIFHNNGYGVLCSSQEEITLSGNAIHDNKDAGVQVKQGARVTVRDNSITSNTGSGLYASTQSQVEVEGNGIYENNEHGAELHGAATLTRNDVFCNRLSALSVHGAAQITTRENRLQAVKKAVVQLGDQCCATVSDNQLYVAGEQAISTSNDCKHTVSGNTVVTAAQEQGEHVSDWHLEDPQPRPHIDAPLPMPAPPPKQSDTTVTRVLIPPQGEHPLRSSLCVVL